MNTEMQRRRQEYLNHVRVLEYAEGQTVSLLEVHGVGKGTIQGLWKIGIQTAEQLLACDIDVLHSGLKTLGLPLGNPDQAHSKIEGWRDQVKRLMTARAGNCPAPLPWEDDE